MITVKNPILEGFYPDPSICAVGDDFYLVTSSFAYFPGVPIFHSKDLAHWEQIGNILDREEQLPLEGCGHSKGIYAPTLRYNNGVFYMITTNVSGGGNFIVTAADPAGEWSKPYFLGTAAEGIDPSLFFDTDGTCYYIGQRDNTEGISYSGDKEIWIQELDLQQMKLIGESRRIWKSALYDSVWSEGPHIYKKDDWYYLMIAEGGTGPEHAVTIARSHNIYGPYEGNKANPILTHRHLGSNYPIRYVGHGDLVKTKNQEWYIVLLASRHCEGYSNLGRETFLAKIVWENDWPVVNIGIGMLTEEVDINLEPYHIPELSQTYHFFGDKLDDRMLKLRNPKEEMYSLKERLGFLRLKLSKEALSEMASPTFVGIRQAHYHYMITTLMEFLPKQISERAGLTIYQRNEYHMRYEVTRKDETNMLCLSLCKKAEQTDNPFSDEEIVKESLIETLITEKEISKKGCNEKVSIVLKIVNHGQRAWFYYSLDKQNYELLVGDISVKDLSTEIAGGFTGCTLGMFATANRIESDNFADFAFLDYQEIKE
jgi:Beta-xylosidase